MSTAAGISLEELLAWSEESASYWKAHLDANPALLELPCSIGGVSTVEQFVRQIWSVDLRWAQRLAGLPVMGRDEAPAGPLDALYSLHLQAMEVFRGLLAGPAESWEEPYILDMDWVPPEHRSVSKRKVAGHALLHSQRHWAQLATLVRSAGFPSKFRGDLLLSSALR